MISLKFKNRVLHSLPVDAIARLHLQPIGLEVRQGLEHPGKPIRFVYFIEEGLASIVSTLQDGTQVECGLCGFESLSGLSALTGAMLSLNRVYIQVPGHGFAVPIASALAEFNRFEQFHDLALRAMQAQLLQTMQLAVCNAKHAVEQRLARWLLASNDRSDPGFDSYPLELSQEFLAVRLGAGRPAVSLAAGNLKREGIIDYTRGSIYILDRTALEKRACECYRTVKSYLEDRAAFDSGLAPRPVRRYT